MNLDEILQDYVMIINRKHIEEQNTLMLQFYANPFRDKKAEFDFTELPFPDLSIFKPKGTKKKSFKEIREEVWEESPEYNLSDVVSKLKRK